MLGLSSHWPVGELKYCFALKPFRVTILAPSSSPLTTLWTPGLYLGSPGCPSHWALCSSLALLLLTWWFQWPPVSTQPWYAGLLYVPVCPF